MVRRTASGKEEPEQATFELPSEKEHLFQVIDVLDTDDPDIFLVKSEVVGGEEEGRSMLTRLSLDDSFKGFFATRLFLKAIGEEYKGDSFPIDTENWPGRQYYADIVHNKSKDGTKTYANIKEYNFEKRVEQFDSPKPQSEEVAWDE